MYKPIRVGTLGKYLEDLANRSRFQTKHAPNLGQSNGTLLPVGSRVPKLELLETQQLVFL